MGLDERRFQQGVGVLGTRDRHYPEVALVDGAAASHIHDETAIAGPVRRESSETEIVGVDRLLVAKTVHLLDVEVDETLC